jgi:hypothetical protein
MQIVWRARRVLVALACLATTLALTQIVFAAVGTTTTITSDAPDPSVVGQSVAVQYTVTPAGGGTPTGNVTVSDGVISCTGTVVGGQCSLTFTSAGAKSLTATYAGDATFSGSTSAAEAHTVDPANTTTTITSDNPDPSTVGQAVTVQNTVMVNALGDGTPTGNVTVSDGVISCTDTVGAGQCSLTFSSAGARSLTATYPATRTSTAVRRRPSRTRSANRTARRPRPSPTASALRATWPAGRST